jgi:hypothetical protein
MISMCYVDNPFDLALVWCGRSAIMPRKHRTVQKQASPAAGKPAKPNEITTLEIASYEAGRKTMSILANISMSTAVKVLALANKESSR